MSVPGCDEGRLTDPRALFLSLVEGVDPNLGEAALTEAMDATLRRYWIKFQRASPGYPGGRLRARLYLPTVGRLDEQDFAHVVDILNTDLGQGQYSWQWRDYSGPYTAAPCGTEVPEPPPPTPPSGDLPARVAVLEEAFALLAARVDRHLKG